jgi:crotonobetaine/carnitine-CoA ligase
MEHYDYSKRTIGHILEDKAEKNKSKIFFQFEDQGFTYKETNENANRMANGYKSLGVKKGDRVVAMLPNSPEYVFHCLGLAKTGGVDTSINTAYKGDLFRHVIDISGAKFMLIHVDFLPRIKLIQDKLFNLEKIIVYCPEGKKIPSDLGLKFPLIDIKEWTSLSFEFTSSETIKPSDPLQIIFTSGTTGPSKGAVLPHHALYCYAADIVKNLQFTKSDIFFSCLPMYHANIRAFSILPALFLDASFAMVERFSASSFWNQCRQYKATTFCLLGGMGKFLYNQPIQDNDRENPARLCCVAPFSPDFAQAFEERFDVKVYTGYFGMTEASGITFMTVDEMDKLKEQGRWDAVVGMGRETTEYDVRLVDDDDNEVPVGQTGEITCRPTRPYSMMLEYVNMPEKTLESFRNLWFHTGDIAKKDEDGYFYFVDRKKDYIRRHGENISSFEVEKAINEHPSILDTAAIGVESEYAEQEILVIIKLREGESLNPSELSAWCEERMAKFMIPRYVRFIDTDFPRTSTGRIEKYRLREVGINKETWDREKEGRKK